MIFAYMYLLCQPITSLNNVGVIAVVKQLAHYCVLQMRNARSSNKMGETAVNILRICEHACICIYIHSYCTRLGVMVNK